MSKDACFHGGSPSSVLLLYETVKDCHGTSPSVLALMVAYKSFTSAKGSSMSGSGPPQAHSAMISINSEIWLTDIWTLQYNRSANWKDVWLLNSVKLPGTHLPQGGGGAP